jgi:hypothetical protein
MTGAVGPTGPTGVTGPTGATGATGPPVTFVGAWSNTATYSAGDSVSYIDGSSYISLVAGNNGNTPNSNPTQWGLLAQAGGTGAAGATGATGPAGPTGPQGPTGATGATGATGPAGLTGPQGATGATGATGGVAVPIFNTVASLSGTFNTTTYVAENGPTASITAGASGNVIVTTSWNASNATADDACYMTFTSTGSAPAQAAGDAVAVSIVSGKAGILGSGSAVHIVTGLTTGTSYTYHTYFRSSAAVVCTGTNATIILQTY